MALMKENYFLDLGNEQIIGAKSQFVDLENILFLFKCFDFTHKLGRRIIYCYLKR